MKKRVYIITVFIGVSVLVLALGLCWALIKTETNVSDTKAEDISNIEKEIQKDSEILNPKESVEPDNTEQTEETLFTETGELNLNFLAKQTIPIIYPDDPDRQARLNKAVEREPMLKAFVLGYPDNPWQVSGGYTAEELAMEHPHFLQYDLRWGYHEYGTTVMGFTGCAPTAMAMVALELTGDTSVTPDVVADYSTQMGTYIPNSGTSWDFFTKCDENFGVHGEILPMNEARMKSELDNGHPIIISLGPGDFTQYGHIAVIVDYDDEGFIVNDPGSTIRTSKRWTFEKLVPQIKQLWVYTKA